MVPTTALTHPPTINRPKYREMVKAAITNLADKKGSSRQAIMKYVIGTYGVVEDGRSKALIRTALVEGVKSGELSQTKGTGASGSFKLGKKPVEQKVKKQKGNGTKNAQNSQKKENKKKVAKRVKPKTEEKPKSRKIEEKEQKNPKKNKTDVKLIKQKKPPAFDKTPKAAKVKAQKLAKTPSPTHTDFQSMSPMKAVSKVKAKLLFTSTPSKKKKGKVSKLVTPKRVVVKTKQLVKKPKVKKGWNWDVLNYF